MNRFFQFHSTGSQVKLTIYTEGSPISIFYAAAQQKIREIVQIFRPACYQLCSSRNPLDTGKSASSP